MGPRSRPGALSMRGASLLILAWNQWPLTRRCLDSLLATGLDEAEIIVVDNGSSDETPEAIAAYLDRIRYRRLPENLGFVRGMNAGIAIARAGNDIVLLNNDLEFSQHDWLGRLRDAAYAAPDHGIIGCRLLGPPPQSLVFHVGGFLDIDNLFGQQTESGHQEREVNQFPRVRRVEGIAFALAYLRRDCIDRIGALDEIFHSYYEDTDYCLRARDAGIATVVAGNVTLRHHQHGSTRDDGGFRARIAVASRQAFAARWHARLLARVRAVIAWHGHAGAPAGRAMLTRGLVGRLQARDLRIHLLEAGTDATVHEDYRVTVAAHRPLPDGPSIAIAAMDGVPRLPAHDGPRVALLWSEWQRLPAAWVDACNAFDHVLVPDDEQEAILRASGVRSAIHVVPLGVDREYLHPSVPSPRHPNGSQVFLTIAECLRRDAPERVVEAFQAAFDSNDPVELIVHVVPGDDAEAIVERIGSLIAPQRGRVRVLHGWKFPSAERGQLHGAADAYVSARRGGGWDPYVREALACGLAVAAPAWGSQRALVERWGWPLTATPCADVDMPGAEWREVDCGRLRDTLRELATRRDELTAAAHARAASFVEHDNLDVTADRLVSCLDRLGVLGPATAKPPPHRPADSTGPSDQVVVLGMHRSGTSSVGGLLALFGAWPGPPEQLLRGDDNPKGHFEHGELHMACLRRLAAAGGDWKHVPEAKPPAAIDAFRREAGTVLDTLEQRRPWFIKEPRLCLLARELLPLLTRPVFVHVARAPLAVADSLARRDGMSRDEALGLWERYTREAFAASDGWPRVLVDYDELVRSPVRTTHRLHADLVAAGVRGLVLPDDAAIVEWVEAPSRTTDVDDDALTATQRALRDALGDRSILSMQAADGD